MDRCQPVTMSDGTTVRVQGDVDQQIEDGEDLRAALATTGEGL